MTKRPWFRRSVVAAAVLLATSWAFALALHAGLGRRYLLAQLSASFGRPVEVSYFDFSLLNGLRLEAHYVSVMDDPRFGAEYFLRADQLSATPRLSQLLRGRIEFGTLSVARASLNLVRDADGRWNMESWLPPAAGPAVQPGAQPGEPSAASSSRPVRLERIVIADGRINFKLGVEKLPFALVDVSGELDQDNAGRWSVDLEAHPMRAAIALQDAGTFRLRGTVAGTSARLRPASISLSWENVSVADAMRLAFGADRGARGMLAAEISASIADPASSTSSSVLPGNWKISGVARFSGLHRWDLAGRDSDPAVNLNLSAAWRPGDQQLQEVLLSLEAPHSRLSAVGDANWRHGFFPHLRLSAPGIGLPDLIAWRDAFLPGFAEDLGLQGSLSGTAEIAGWPPRLQQANVESPGAVLRVKPLSGPVRLGPLRATLHADSLVLQPVAVRMPGVPLPPRPRKSQSLPPPAAGLLQVEGVLTFPRVSGSPASWPYRLSVRGQTTRVQDLLALAGVGGRLPGDWAVDGPAALQLSWEGDLRRGGGLPLGTVALRELRVTNVLSKELVVISSATVELQASAAHLRIAAAQAFGASWKGSFDRRYAEPGWSFDLSADRLDVADIGRRFGQQVRAGLLAQILPSPGPVSSSPETISEDWTARGRLRSAEVLLGSLRLTGFDSAVEVGSRGLAFQHLQAETFGGKAAGDFELQWSPVPGYVLHAEFNRLSLAALAEGVGLPADHFAGVASGDASISARGATEKELLSSLTGQGSWRVRDAVIRAFDAVGANAADFHSGASPHAGTATVSFHLANGGLDLDHCLFVSRDAQYRLAGGLDFIRGFNLMIQSVPGAGEANADEASFDQSRDSWVVTGPLDSPEIVRQTNLARGTSASASVRR